MSDIAKRFDAWVRKKYAESPRLQRADEMTASAVNHINGADAQDWADKKLGNDKRPEKVRSHEEIMQADDSRQAGENTAHGMIEFARGVNPVAVKLAEKAATLPAKARSDVNMARNYEYPPVVPLAPAPDGSELHVNPSTGGAMYATPAPAMPQGAIPAASMAGPSQVAPKRRFFGLGGGIPVQDSGMMASKKKRPDVSKVHPQSLDEQIAHLQKMKIAQDEQDEGLKNSQPAVQPKALDNTREATVPEIQADEDIRKRYDPGY